MKKSIFSRFTSQLWIGLLLFSSLVLVYFMIICFYDLYSFFSLNKSVPAINVNFKIFETKNELFQLEASYSYLVDNKEYKLKEILNQPVFDNPYQLRKVLESKIKQNFEVYYSKRTPEKGRLQKEFSIKKIVDFLLALGLFLYFFFLSENQRQNFFKKELNKCQ